MAVFDASQTAMLVDYGGFAVEFAPSTSSNDTASVVTFLERGKRTEALAKVFFADTSDDTLEVTTPHC